MVHRTLLLLFSNMYSLCITLSNRYCIPDYLICIGNSWITFVATKVEITKKCYCFSSLIPKGPPCLKEKLCNILQKNSVIYWAICSYHKGEFPFHRVLCRWLLFLSMKTICSTVWGINFICVWHNVHLKAIECYGKSTFHNWCF